MNDSIDMTKVLSTAITLRHLRRASVSLLHRFRSKKRGSEDGDEVLDRLYVHFYASRMTANSPLSKPTVDAVTEVFIDMTKVYSTTVTLHHSRRASVSFELPPPKTDPTPRVFEDPLGQPATVIRPRRFMTHDGADVWAVNLDRGERLKVTAENFEEAVDLIENR